MMRPVGRILLLTAIAASAVGCGVTSSSSIVVPPKTSWKLDIANMPSLPVRIMVADKEVQSFANGKAGRLESLALSAAIAKDSVKVEVLTADGWQSQFASTEYYASTGDARAKFDKIVDIMTVYVDNRDGPDDLIEIGQAGWTVPKDFVGQWTIGKPEKAENGSVKISGKAVGDVWDPEILKSEKIRRLPSTLLIDLTGKHPYRINEKIYGKTGGDVKPSLSAVAAKQLHHLKRTISFFLHDAPDSITTAGSANDGQMATGLLSESRFSLVDDK